MTDTQKRVLKVLAAGGYIEATRRHRIYTPERCLGGVADRTMDVLKQNAWIEEQNLPPQNGWVNVTPAYVITLAGREAMASGKAAR